MIVTRIFKSLRTVQTSNPNDEKGSGDGGDGPSGGTHGDSEQDKRAPEPTINSLAAEGLESVKAKNNFNQYRGRLETGVKVFARSDPKVIIPYVTPYRPYPRRPTPVKVWTGAVGSSN